MILDNLQNIGQRETQSACKIMIPKRAPVAQWIERSPPKPTADRWQTTARAQNPTFSASNKPSDSCAKHRCFVRPLMRILDAYLMSRV